MRTLLKTIVYWLPLAAATVVMGGTIYVAVHQSIRQGANEQPAQMAQDIKYRLEHGSSHIAAIHHVDSTTIEQCTAPFAIITNNEGITLLSTATLRGRLPAIPAGVLLIARDRGENRRTWEPAHGLRYAIIALPYTINGIDGYVVAGKPLREAELRTALLTGQVAVGTIFALFTTFVITFFTQLVKAKQKNNGYEQ